MDIARAYIAAVMLKLDELADVDEGTHLFKVGFKSFQEQDSPPIIKWAYGTISHDQAVAAGSIYSEIQQLIVRVWHFGEDQDEAETNTRTLKNNLLLAAREVATGGTLDILSRLTVGDFEWAEEAHNRHGRWLEGSLFIRLAVPDQPVSTVLIESTQYDARAKYADSSTELIASVVDPPAP